MKYSKAELKTMARRLIVAKQNQPNLYFLFVMRVTITTNTTSKFVEAQIEKYAR